MPRPGSRCQRPGQRPPEPSIVNRQSALDEDTCPFNYTGNVLKAANRLTVKYSDVPVNRYDFEYIYQAPRELVDFRMDYKWSRKFTPYFQARNVFGRPIVTSTQARPSNHAEYGDPIYELGVRGAW